MVHRHVALDAESCLNPSIPIRASGFLVDLTDYVSNKEASYFQVTRRFGSCSIAKR
jgi:hypothetical protein